MPGFEELNDRQLQIKNIMREEIRTATDLKMFKPKNEAVERYDVDYTKKETSFIDRFLYEDGNKNIPELTQQERARLLTIQSRNRSHILINDQKFSGDSESMRTVKSTILALEQGLANSGNSIDDLTDIDSFYENAIKACESYVSSHDPFFSTGKERKKMVQERLDSLRQEYSIFENARAAFLQGKLKNIKKPLDLIEAGRNLSINQNIHQNDVFVPVAYSWDELNQFEIVKEPKFKMVSSFLAKRKLGDSFKEKLTSEKRQQERLTPGTELYIKNANANRLLSIDKDQKTIRLAKIAGLGSDEMLIDPEEAEMTSVFAHSSMELSDLLNKFSSSSIEVRKEAFSNVVKAVLITDLSNIDVSTDEAIVRDARRFANLAEIARAAEYLKFRHKDVFDTMPEELKAKFEAQRINIARFGVYYELKKSVLTDDYYRDHRDSELSLNITKNSTKEQKRLLFKLHASDACAETDKLCKGRDYKYPQIKQKIKGKNDQLFDKDVMKLRAHVSGEFNKTRFPIEGTVHEAYFNDLANNPQYAAKLRRLAGGSYKVVGVNKKCSENLFRSIGIMANLKEIQEMSLDDVKELVDNLSAVAENDTPQAIEEAKQRNIRGLKDLKSIAYRHMRYLYEKYGNNDQYSDPSEAGKHSLERAKDWVWMCDVTCGIVHYLDDLGLVDHKSQENIEFMKLSSKLSSTHSSISGNSLGDGLFHDDDNEYITNISTYMASYANRIVGSGINDYAFKNDKFMFSFVDHITSNNDDLDVHRDAKYREFSNESSVSTIGKMLKVQERQKQRAEQKAEIGELLKSRWSFFGWAPSDSSEMTAVKDGYRDLLKALNEIPVPELQKEQLGNIDKAYKNLFSACDTYIKYKDPTTADGKERLNKVKRLKAFMQKEKAEFSAIRSGVKFENYRSFSEMLDKNLPEEFDKKLLNEKVISPKEVVTDRARMWEYLERIPYEAEASLSIKKKAYKRKLGKNGYAERIDINKRIENTRNPKSRLYKKEMLAQQYITASSDYIQTRVDRIEAASKNIQGHVELPEEEFELLSFFMDADQYKNEKLLSLYQKEDKTDAYQLIIWQFMNTTIPTIDFSSEEGLLEHVYTMEKLCGMVTSIQTIMEKNPDFMQQMPEKIRQRCEAKFNDMGEVCKYYTLRTSIFTNDYYRSHYDDELDNRVVSQDAGVNGISALLKLEKDYLEGGELPDELIKRDLSRDVIPAAQFATRQKSRIRRIREEVLCKQLLMSKWSYFGIEHEDTKEMTDVKQNYQALNVLLREQLPDNREAVKAKWQEITRKFEDTIGFCDVYLKNRNPSTEDGKLRKSLVENLRKQMESDLALVRAGYENSNNEMIRSFEELLLNRQPVTVKVNKLPDNIGKGTSIVYKLDEGGKVSYFKPAEKKVDRKNPVDIMEKIVVPQNDLQKELLPSAIEAVKLMHIYPVEGMMTATEGIFEALIMTLPKVLKWKEQNSQTFEQITQFVIKTGSELEYPEDYPTEDVVVPEDEDEPEHVEKSAINCMSYYFKSALKDDGTYDETKFYALVDIYMQTYQTFNAGRQMYTMLSLKGDENLAVRNVASSRVADVFGVGDVLAKSESACVELPDGKQIYGIKMEEAKGISLQELITIASNKENRVVVMKEAMGQYLKLKFLDAICEQIDRSNHSNVICDVKETKMLVNGETKTLYTVAGIKGIDNDLAFGNADPTTIRTAMRSILDRFQKIPKEIVEQFINADVNELSSSVADVLEPEARDKMLLRFTGFKQVLQDAMRDDPGKFIDSKEMKDFYSLNDIR